MNQIRNFCIIAHIDHGKSTLADRLLEVTGTIEKRKMKNQILDQMDLERERGITIKLQPARMKYDYLGEEYELNLIDTPGHVDFTYEVSRSLAAVEGALLVVDATQGVQAQTIANLYLALEQGLEIIPVINKIDLPAADTEKTSREILELLGVDKEEIIFVSAKSGAGIAEVLAAIIKKIPPPKINKDLLTNKFSRALIFDSKFDDYKGVVAYIRVVAGEFRSEDAVYFIGAGAESQIGEIGFFKPEMVKTNVLMEGEIGYAVTGLKRIEDCRVGDTITKKQGESASGRDYEKLALPGYKEVKPMVFAGIYCKEGNDYGHLRESLIKLKLTDAALVYEPEASPALGFGFRAGFLGLLHLEIVQERLRREYGLELIVTVPSVAYKIKKSINQENNKSINQENDGGFVTIHSPVEMPNQGEIEEVREPWVKADIVVPKEYLGGIMELSNEKRGKYVNTEYFSEDTVILHYELPLASILVDFYDKLKSASRGYATLNYEFIGYRQAEVERLDFLVAEELVEALCTIVYSDEAYRAGKKIVESLREVLPRQMFEVKIQAVLGYQEGKNKGGKIIASSRIPPMRKDVTAKLYGGDVTRKRKLLEKQKKGKKKMKSFGKVDIPTEAYVAVLKR